jgi:prepilin-type N-terminal cleavage/methylation domain-containing protein
MSGRKAAQAFTLVEMMVAVAIGSIVIVTLAGFSLYTSRSLLAISNYDDLDQQSQLALDKFCKQVRQVKQLNSYVTNAIDGTITSLTFQDYDDVPLTFTYDSGAKTLFRLKSGVSKVYLTGCDSLQFQIFQRTPVSNTFDCVTTATAANCKLVEVNWSCSRRNPQMAINSQSMQSAKICLRN